MLIYSKTHPSYSAVSIQKKLLHVLHYIDNVLWPCGTESEIIMYGNPHLLTYRLITSGIDTGPSAVAAIPEVR